MGDITHDVLAAIADGHILHCNIRLAAGSVTLGRFHLRSVRWREPGERNLRFPPLANWYRKRPMTDVVIIENGRHERNYWSDIWRYRELFYVLAWRDVAVRYKQTIIGASWALIRPFLTMVVFTVVFSRIAKLPSDGVTPYPLMVFVGTLPWTFFSTGLTDASNSLIGNSNLISKIYFPRLIVPIAAVVVAFADFLIAFAILIGMM